MLRIWLVTMVAKEFGVTPYQAAKDLDRDPELLSLRALNFLRYQECKSAFDNAKSAESLAPWEGTAILKAVKKNHLALHKARKARKEALKAAAEGKG